MKKINGITKLIGIVLMLTIAISLVALQSNFSVEAQAVELQPNMGIPLPDGVTADYKRTTFAYLSVYPNPVGVGQEVIVNIWTTPGTDRFKGHRDYTVTITKPDGTQNVFVKESYWADATSWLTFTPDQIGEWKLKFEFPGNYFPAGTYADPQGTGTAATAVRTWDEYYLPSSTPETILRVQEEPVSTYPQSPLPTDYWTRPIPLEHREWWTIAGNYPWRGPGGGPEWDELYPDTNPYWGAKQQFTPWTLGPNSPHIVWMQRHDLTGGIIGGDLETFSRVATATNPSILYNGMGYWSITRVVDGEPISVWECFDIRTGELLWQRRGVTQVPTIIEYDIAGLAVPGVQAKPSRPDLVHLGGGRLIKYNPSNGAVTLNVSIDPMTGTGGTYYMNGHVIGVQNLGTAVPVAERYRLITWTTLPSTSDFSARVVSNITWPWTGLGTDQDFNTGIAAWTTGGGRDATRIRVACLITGRELWDITTEESLYMAGCTKVDHGKVAVLMRGGYYKAYDERTGNVVWTSEKMLYPWGEASWASYSVSSAYGMLFQQTNDAIYAFDWDTGKIVWRYEDNNPWAYESPYTGEDGGSVHPLYNFGAGLRIVDGKVYATNGWHSPVMPLMRGYGTHAIDVFTGEQIWRVAIRQSGFGTASVGQVHDGYFSVAATNGYVYFFGKGQSQTTISAPSVEVQLGQRFTITGTVLDTSPAQPDTPAISDEDMGAWMEYLHMQQPKPADAKGVTVSLTAIDPNGNLIDVGEATSDLEGVFGYSWSPEVPGLYQIIATFAGSESYGSSSASTYLTAVDTPASTPEPTQPPASVADMYFVPAIAGIIAAIAIVGALLALLLLKKRP